MTCAPVGETAPRAAGISFRGSQRSALLGTALAEETFDNDPARHCAFLDWAARTGRDAVVGIEGSASFGAPLARFLVASGWIVREVPPRLSRRERFRTRRAGESDPADALAIARVTLREPDLPLVRLVDSTLELQLLVEAREDLVAEQTRVRNRAERATSDRTSDANPRKYESRSCRV